MGLTDDLAADFGQLGGDRLLGEVRIERVPGFVAMQQRLTDLVAALTLQVHDLIG